MMEPWKAILNSQPRISNKTDTDNLLSNKVSTTGDVSLNGNLFVDGGSIRIEPTTGHSVIILDQAKSIEFGSNSYSLNAFGRYGDGSSRFKFYNSRSGSSCNVSIDGDLDVDGNMTLKGSVLSVGGVTNEDGSIYIYSPPANYTGHQRFWQDAPHQYICDFLCDSPNLYSYIRLKGSSYLRFNSLSVAV